MKEVDARAGTLRHEADDNVGERIRRIREGLELFRASPLKRDELRGRERRNATTNRAVVLPIGRFPE